MNNEIIKLHKEIEEFKGPLYGSGKCVIFRSKTGDINPPIQLLVVGEAPGYHESVSGIPFVGKSGKELDKILDVLDFDYVITNVVKYRPVDESGLDRKPTDEEVQAWFPLLQKQIKLYKPKAILALGDTAMKALTKTKIPITYVVKMRFVFYYDKIPVFVYFHPSFILRTGYDWSKDIDFLKQELSKVI
jgi:DNA polymerase